MSSEDELPPEISDSRGLALIVDDEPVNRLILEALLKKESFDVIQAENGREGVEAYKIHLPQIVFMDVMMPVMDGYEATRLIKSINSDVFIPVIFLTVLSDEDSLIKCLDVGGDDFLNKPFTKSLLTAKINALERTRKLQNRTSELLSRIVEDEAAAVDVYERAVFSNNVAMDFIDVISRPASLFSGDIILTSYSPSRDLYVLLGDFTGHGLGAALGALPTAELFRNMASKGQSPDFIVEELNRKLFNLLPSHMFMATQLIVLSADLRKITVLSCGMPDVLVVDSSEHKIRHRVAAEGPPLGAFESFDFKSSFAVLPVFNGDHIVMTTDGLTEAVNNDEKMYGESRFELSITNAQNTQHLLPEVMQSLAEFAPGIVQNDDITLLDVPIIPNLFPVLDSVAQSETDRTESEHSSEDIGSVTFKLNIRGAALRKFDPTPLVLANFNSVVDLGAEDQVLYTIITELYLNALEHGVLKLTSDLKEGPDGFTAFYSEKEKRLSALVEGEVRIEATIEQQGQYLLATIKIEDSGLGFDYQSVGFYNSDANEYHGRGIALIDSLCHSFGYVGDGSCVVAVHRWCMRS